MSKGFVFAVSNNGVCSVVSSKSGKTLTGGALKACERSVLRDVRVCVFGEWGLFRAMRRGNVVATMLKWRRACFVPAVSSVELPVSSVCSIVVGSFLWDSCVKAYRGSAVRNRRLKMTLSETELSLQLVRIRKPKYFHDIMFRPSFRLAFRGCGSWFSRHIASCRCAGFGEGWRRLRVRSSKFLRWVPRRLRWGSVSLGSGLLLTDEQFLRSVASGICPVKLSLSSYRWPVRSAVLGSLLASLFSKRVRAVVEGEGFRQVALRFVKSALRSLGYYGFSVSRFSVNKAALFVSRGCDRLFWPELPIKAVSSKALFVAFVSLSRCLDWLCAPVSGGRGCPQSLRPLLCSLVLSLLPIVGKNVLCRSVA